MENPSIRFVTTRDARIAYQVFGDEGPTLVFQPGWPSHLEVLMEHPAVSRFVRRLAAFSKVVLFDWRGTGLSQRGAFDRPDGVHDMATVLEAAGSERCWFVGCGMATRYGVLFVTEIPERAEGLVTFAGHPATYRDHEYPWAPLAR